MRDSQIQGLQFLERQFNDIKPLLSVANSMLYETHAETKFSRSSFRRHTEFWERLHRNRKYDVVGEIPEAEQDLLRKVLFHYLAYTVEAKKVADAAAKSQKLCKYDLLALLGQLSEQVMAEPVIDPIPVFSSISGNRPRWRFLSNYPFKDAETRTNKLRTKLLEGKEHPTTRSRLEAIVSDIRHYAIPEREKWESLEMEKKKYRKLIARSAERTHLCRAYDLVHSMHELRIKQIRQLADRSGALVGKLEEMEAQSN